MFSELHYTGTMREGVFLYYFEVYRVNTNTQFCIFSQPTKNFLFFDHSPFICKIFIHRSQDNNNTLG